MMLTYKCNGTIFRSIYRFYSCTIPTRNSVLPLFHVSQCLLIRPPRLDKLQKSYFSNIKSSDPVVPSSDDHVSDIFKNIDLKEFAGDDPDLLKKLKVIMLEVEVMRQDGSKVPDRISAEQWKDIFSCKTRSQRMKYISYLFITEKRKENDRRKKEEKRQNYAQSKLEFEERKSSNKHIFYGLGGSTIFLRIYDSTIDHFHNHKLIRAMLYGQKIVMDMSYDVHMTPKEAANCAKQLTATFAVNRSHDDPFDLHLCKANPNSVLVERLKRFIPTMYSDSFPINITEKSYLDIFPKEKLVYLTPHCNEELSRFNHDDIYIIGAMVDKVNCDPLSLAKAKKEGLRMAKLPLDRYLHWLLGTKSLTVNQMMSIMLDLKTTGDWKKALEHVPKRKILQPHQIEQSQRHERSPFRRKQSRKIEISSFM